MPSPATTLIVIVCVRQQDFLRAANGTRQPPCIAESRDGEDVTTTHLWDPQIGGQEDW